jgi:hypothetical protein
MKAISSALNEKVVRELKSFSSELLVVNDSGSIEGKVKCLMRRFEACIA